MKYSRVKFRTDRDGTIIVFENCGCEAEARTFRPCRMHKGDAHQAARLEAEAPKRDEGKSVRNERTGPESRLGLPLLPDAAHDPDSYLRSVKKIGYMVWTAAGLYVILSCVLDQFSDFLGYWLPAISFAADNGVWWAQVPALAFLGAVICFGVVMTGYNLLSRILRGCHCRELRVHMRRSSRSSQNIEADLSDLFRGWADFPVAKRGYPAPKLLDRPNGVPDKEAQKELLRCGCNYVTYCVTMDFLASEKNRLEKKYGVELEAYSITYTFEERAGYLLGVVIPYHLIHPPRLIQ